MRIKLLLLLSVPMLLFGQKLARPAESSSETVYKQRGYVGLTFSVKHSKGENYKELNLIPLEEKNQLRWSVNALGGYFLKKQFSVGGGISYKYSRIEAAMTDTTLSRSAQSTIALVPHIRNYLPWTEDLFFQIFNQTNLGISYGTGVEETDNGTSLNRTYITDFGLNLGIQPGLSVFVGKGVTVETSVNLLGFKMNRRKIEENGVETGYRNDAGVDFNIDLFSINLGLTVYI